MCLVTSAKNTQYVSPRYLKQSTIEGTRFGIISTMCSSSSIGNIAIVYPSRNISPAALTAITSLPNKRLTTPINISVELDEDGFLASIPDIPTLYGYGDSRIEAIEMLAREIESLYEDLLGDDQFSDDWTDIKQFLSNRIIN